MSNKSRRSSLIVGVLVALPLLCVIMPFVPLLFSTAISRALFDWQQGITGILGIWCAILVALLTIRDSEDRERRMQQHKINALKIVLTEDTERTTTALSSCREVLRSINTKYPRLHGTDLPHITTAHTSELLAAMPLHMTAIYASLTNELGEIGSEAVRATAEFYAAVGTVEGAMSSLHRSFEGARDGNSGLCVKVLDALDVQVCATLDYGTRLLEILRVQREDAPQDQDALHLEVASYLRKIERLLNNLGSNA